MPPSAGPPQFNGPLLALKQLDISGRASGYWVESTAPDNVDDAPGRFRSRPSSVSQQRIMDAIDEAPALEIADIAERLVGRHNPNLVISVHGFNNPRAVAAHRHWTTFKVMQDDPEIASEDLVFIGYRWPSERMGSPLPRTIPAMPWSLIGLAILALLMVAGAFAAGAEGTHGPFIAMGIHVVRDAGWFLLAFPCVLAVLRAMVYFRDEYRAIHYAVPDLVELLRDLDAAVARVRQERGKNGSEPRLIEISFIGHSMGALVVTHAVRILSDLFGPGAVGTNSMDDDANRKPPSTLGSCMDLARLVLVSPDIPAEALMLGRANYLSASLHRFKEASLFSSRGDVVLKMVSTLANYFAFPTRSRANGFRLGNAGIPLARYGVVNYRNGAPDPAVNPLNSVCVGPRLLQDLNGLPPGAQPALPVKFSYFDCTDCRDLKEDYTDGDRALPCSDRPVRILTGGHKDLKLRWWDDVWLLVLYLATRVDVHAGYFDGVFTRSLIYRSACLDRPSMLQSLGGTGDIQQLNAECEQRQIKALVAEVQA